MSSDHGLRYLQSISAKRAARWHADTPWSLSDWMTATVGELGEAANVIKKLNRHRDGVATDRDPSVEELKAELRLELADTLAYLVLVAAEAGVDLAEAFVEKFNVVSERQGWDDMRIEPLSPALCPSCGGPLDAAGECTKDRFWASECSDCGLPRRECECNR